MEPLDPKRTYDDAMAQAAASLRVELDQRKEQARHVELHQPGSINVAEGLTTLRLPPGAASLTADETRTWLRMYADRRKVPYETLRILEPDGQVVDPADLVDPEAWSDEAKVARRNLEARLLAKRNELAGTPGNRAQRRAAKRNRR